MNKREDVVDESGRFDAETRVCCGRSKYLIVLASGSTSTAPEIEAANFFDGNSIRAVCGDNAAAISARRSVAFSLFRFRALRSDAIVGMNEDPVVDRYCTGTIPASLSEESNCDRVEDMSRSAWEDRNIDEHHCWVSLLFPVAIRIDHSSNAYRSTIRSPEP